MTDMNKILDLDISNDMKMALMKKHVPNNIPFDYSITKTSNPQVYLITKGDEYVHTKLVGDELKMFNKVTNLETSVKLSQTSAVIDPNEKITYIGLTSYENDAYMSAMDTCEFIFRPIGDPCERIIFGYYYDYQLGACYFETRNVDNTTPVKTPLGELIGDWQKMLISKESAKNIYSIYKSYGASIGYISLSQILYHVCEKKIKLENFSVRKNANRYEISSDGNSYVYSVYDNKPYVVPKQQIDEQLSRATDHPVILEYIYRGIILTTESSRLSYSHLDSQNRHVFWYYTKNVILKQVSYNTDFTIMSSNGMVIQQDTVIICDYGKQVNQKTYSGILAHMQQHPAICADPGPYLTSYIDTIINAHFAPVQKTMTKFSIDKSSNPIIHFADGSQISMIDLVKENRIKPTPPNKTTFKQELEEMALLTFQNYIKKQLKKRSPYRFYILTEVPQKYILNWLIGFCEENNLVFNQTHNTISW